MHTYEKFGFDLTHIVVAGCVLMLVVVISLFVLFTGLRGTNVFGTAFGDRQGAVTTTAPAHAEAEAVLHKSDKLK
jgi:hypothetical protein